MTTEHEATRTLVKSPPELWAECSDAGSLARHLGEFGDITITRLEPETTVAWEGERASGTVRIEPSGWGTRVTLTAQMWAEVADVGPSGVEAEPEVVEAELPLAERVTEAVKDALEAPAAEDTVEEEIDATPEEEPEAPDPALGSDAGAFRIRWRRMTGRMKGVFRPGKADAVVEPPIPVDAAESIPPPDALSRPDAREPDPTVEPDAVPEPDPIPEPDPVPVPEPTGESDVQPQSPEEANPDPELILTAALDSLGQAHHRPFSRA
jgi:hypothetical protein